jgi:hypothetical protein
MANKEKHKELVKKIYHTPQGQEYEKKKRCYPTLRFSRGKYAAIKRKKDWTLTLEQYLSIIGNNCKYCNGSVAEETGHSLDRIDNERGYHFDNVNICCKDCNRRRSKSMSAVEFERQSKLNGRWKD